tara:strand:- start:7813 stop:12327 length:4515 start_codon:yes stop_codon:yes gene_type:complete
MALSVKRLIHGNDCPEPTNQVAVNYHATSAEELCNGNGTLTSIFADNYGTLFEIQENDEPVLGSNGDLCPQGMDVVFALDYTYSGVAAIDAVVNTGFNAIINQINTESGGDYRLSLVLFDGSTTNSSPNYATSGYYQNIPAAQKVSQTAGGGVSGNVFITCLEQFGTVGSSTAFNNAVSALNASVNSATGMVLGHNIPAGGHALYEIGSNGIAGQWRDEALKLIILVSGSAHPENLAYFQNNVLPYAQIEDIQHHVRLKDATSPGYEYICNNTMPAGSFEGSQNFGVTAWIPEIAGSVTDLCDESFTYDCDPAPVGWYMALGGSTAYYWNGTAWNNSHTCDYTLKINLVDGTLTNTSIDDISSGHANYFDADTFEITGAAGTTFNITHTLSADPDYAFTDITQNSNILVSGSGNTLTVYTDNGVGSSTADATLSANEFRLSGTINADGEYNVVLGATASQIQHRVILTVIADETQNQGSGGDTLDASNNAQTAGYNTITPVLPASGWDDVSSSYYANSRRYSFDGYTGDTVSFDVEFDPSPSDYNLTLESVTATYSNSGVQNAVAGNYTLSNTNKDLTGSFTIPQGGGEVTLRVLAQVNQPDFSFTLSASENITGAVIDGAPYSETFTGYTGDTFNYEVALSTETDYNAINISSVNETGDIGAVTTSIDNTANTVSGVVTMPSGGGAAGLLIAGTASRIRHTYTVTIVDPYTDSASWPQISFVGETGTSHSQTVSLQNADPDVTYSISGLTNAGGVTSSHSGTDITVNLASMPQGGGSGTVTVAGSAVSNQYTFTTNYVFFDADGCTWEANGGSTYSVVTTGAADSTHSVAATFETPMDYELIGASITDDTSHLTTPSYTITNGNTYGNISQTLTMPSGGGSATVTVNPTVRERSYTFTLTVQTSLSGASVNNYSEALASSASEVSGTNNGNGTVTITYGPMGAGDSVNNVQVALSANNSTDYTTEINSFGYSSGLAALLTPTENEYGGEGAELDFTMNSQDPRVASISSGTLTIAGSLVGISQRFILTVADTIANVSPNPSQLTFDGVVGSQHNYTANYAATSGYTYNITSDTESGDTGAFTSNIQPGGQAITGVITMPSGGGSGTITAGGTSSQITYDFDVVWNNAVSNAKWTVNNADTYTQTLSNMYLGETRTISQTVSADSGYTLDSLSAYDNHSNIEVVSANASTGVVQVRVTMPSSATGDQSGTVTASGSTSQETSSLRINYSLNPGLGDANVHISNAAGSSTEVTYDDFSGVLGTSGTVTRWLVPDSGYVDATISSVSESPTDTELSNVGAGAVSGDSQAFSYTYHIISSGNGSGQIAIIGSASTDCGGCDINAAAPSPTSWGGGVDISVIVIDACTPTYSWTVNGVSETPVADGPLEYRFRNKTAGTYTIVLTDSNGCTATDTVTITNPVTTTEGTTYYYHNVRDCNLSSGPTFVARSTSPTSRFQLWNVGIAEPNMPNVVRIISANVEQSPHQMTLTSQTYSCPEEGGDPEGPQP